MIMSSLEASIISVQHNSHSGKKHLEVIIHWLRQIVINHYTQIAYSPVQNLWARISLGNSRFADSLSALRELRTREKNWFQWLVSAARYLHSGAKCWPLPAEGAHHEGLCWQEMGSSILATVFWLIDWLWMPGFLLCYVCLWVKPKPPIASLTAIRRAQPVNCAAVKSSAPCGVKGKPWFSHVGSILRLISMALDVTRWTILCWEVAHTIKPARYIYCCSAETPGGK